MKNKLHGSIVALVTPFRGGRVALDDFKRLILWHLEAGTQGFVIAGTTGESMVLTPEESLSILEIAVKTVDRRVPIYFGAGALTAQEVIARALPTQNLGIDGLLIITPYYVKPTQEALFRHYKAIHDATTLPILLYNNPGRTAVNLELGTIARLAPLPRIVGIKDSTTDFGRTAAMREKHGPNWVILSGDDSLWLKRLELGADGVISTTANVVPAQFRAIQNAWDSGDTRGAQTMHAALMPLIDAIFMEASPAPAKTALSLLNRIDPDVRPPLCEMLPENMAKLKDVMKAVGIEIKPVGHAWE